MTDSIPTPEEELEALEQIAIDGGDVTPTQMAEAREKISLAGLIAKGVAMRAEAKRRKEAEEAKASAKLKAAKFFDEASTPSLESIHATARAALDKFLRQLDEHNALVARAGQILDSARVVHPNQGLVNPHDEPGFDLAFHVRQDGDRYSAVCVNGVTRPTVHTGSEFQKLIHDAAYGNSLKTRGNADLAYKIGRV